MSPAGPVAGRRRAVAVHTLDGVRRADLPGAQRLPVIVSPERDDVNLAAWAARHAGQLTQWLHEYGAIMFRGFGVTEDSFGPTVTALCGERLAYTERSSPRTAVGDRIYTATDHPSDQRIALHNENSYQQQFPALLAFFCAVAPAGGGATPLADTRQILARLDPEVVRVFAAKGVRYVRNYGGGVGLPWTEVFQTSDRNEVAAYCREHGIEVTWHGPDRLTTSHVRPAVGVHPGTGERVWFNHAAFFHVSSLEPQVREALITQFGYENLPNNTCYGDGTPIAAEVLEQLRGAYRAEEAAVGWRAGDVLLVDNMLASHGRQAFTGPRRVLVAMSGTLAWRDVQDGAAGAVP
ncbi:peptide synthase [Mycobacteroides abscessus subsp. abscessus]|uniref:TauD/TfdA family dioxygenase n=1 Tax=Mycobacteroides abscessus TaxID=36809 RepID=UPI00025846AA|nr:TauD/TfdA family dioxygenase [Mycobacteroides abscessus]EIC67552.1 taurine catabolism dioxygenase TauD/TfdA [Mycobacteroides abscessus M93]CPV55682.1 peptide synthase [Mycobacteroides abscessus]SHQ63959.1 peptide synthase [Mycobacteroides abscessus subsp. abscessus]SHR33405.1 peptide synthase [Mycobacteroides abscessus subsp. abscessus]SHZ30726.1 peptide synthase [Mycobacteroides abscessus subsp. abscessus]